MSARHTHPNLAADGADLVHEHDRGGEGHTHTVEVELLVARLLDSKPHGYARLSPHAQRVVARGIAAMRSGLVAQLSDATAAAYPPPTAQQLRAPLVNRQKGAQRSLPDRAREQLQSKVRYVETSHARCPLCEGKTQQKLDPRTGRGAGPAVLVHTRPDCPNTHVHDERLADIALLDHVFSASHQLDTSQDMTSAAYARRWHDQQHGGQQP